MSLSLTAQLLAVSIVSLQRQISHNNNVNRTTIDSSYDYIVVGSGAAGAIVAYRLAANPMLRVLLLEAGGAQTIVSDMPGLITSLVDTELDWQYLTVPQARVGQAYTDHRLSESKGKVLGGSSTINGMIYNRGNRRGYDDWANTYGATGWDYESVLPYFMRSENNTDPSIVAANPGFHGTSGRVQISNYPHPDELLFKFQDQMHSFGIPTVDINGPTQLGTMIYQATVTPTGVRSSTGNAFIDPNPFPNNLHILSGAQATRVLFNIDGSNITATGVEYRRLNVTHTVHASREVIISAGAIASPQLLLLSGVGPRDHLQSFNIPVVADLPVGNNFHDHVYVPQYFEVKNISLMNEAIGPTTQQYYDYYFHQTGLLAQFPNCGTYLSTITNDNADWPNALISVDVNNVMNNITRATANYGVNQRQWTEFWQSYLGQRYMLLNSFLYRVYSRGTIRLASTDATVHPLIDPNLLSDARDMRAVVDIVKMMYYLTQTGRFSESAQLIPRPIPGCSFCRDTPLYKCDSYVRCIVDQIAIAGLHPGGACRMGAANRTDVVVDPQLRVLGINGLRVIDSSIMPVIPNANAVAASMMIGEKGAQLLLDSI